MLEYVKWCCVGFESFYGQGGRQGAGILVGRDSIGDPEFIMQYRAADAGEKLESSLQEIRSRLSWMSDCSTVRGVVVISKNGIETRLKTFTDRISRYSRDVTESLLGQSARLRRFLRPSRKCDQDKG